MLLPPVTGALQGAPAQPTESAAADTQRPFIQFGANTGAVPPADKYVTRDDHIQVTLLTSIAGPFWFSSRILMPNGQITVQQERILAAGTRALEFFSFVVPEGFLLSLDVAAQGGSAPIRGQTWVRVAIQRALGNINPLQTVLAQGYLSLGCSIGWPMPQSEYLSRGPGASIEQIISNPGAGVDWTVTVPTNAVWVLYTARASFVTSAAVANRIPRLQFFDGATLILDIPTTAVITASQTCSISWGAGGTSHAPTGTLFSVGFPPGVRLSGSFSIRTTTTAIDAADQWSNVRLYVQEYNGTGG